MPLVKQIVANAELFCEARQGRGFPAPLDSHRSAAVYRLLKARRPSAVCFAVRAVIVVALDAMTRRTRPHVSEEGIERFPSRIEVDATPAITMELDVAAVAATLAHSNPRNKCRAMSVARVQRSAVGRGAAATDAQAVAERTRENRALRSALAKTNVADYFDLLCPPKYRPLPKAFASQINVFHTCVVRLRSTSLRRWLPTAIKSCAERQCKDRFERIYHAIPRRKVAP